MDWTGFGAIIIDIWKIAAPSFVYQNLLTVRQEPVFFYFRV